MTMTEETTPPPAKPKRPRAYRRRAARAPEPATTTMPPELEGLTLLDCCSGCNDMGCKISGDSYCAHPRKGGLHAKDMSNPAALARFNKAKAALGHLILDMQNAVR